MKDNKLKQIVSICILYADKKWDVLFGYYNDDLIQKSSK